MLLDGFRLDDWEFLNPQQAPIESVMQVGTDGVVNVTGRPAGYLQTRASFDNYELHFEWRWTGNPGNSGILLHVDSGPIDRDLWPRCLQIQTKHTRAGDILPMAGASFVEALSTPPEAKTPQLDRHADSSENPVGEWNMADVVCRAGVVEVRINGVLQNRVTGCLPAAGKIALQLENTAYAVRGVRVRSLAKR